MKRIGFIYEKVCDVENIKHAIMKASLGKRKQKRVAIIINNIDYYAENISNMLKNKNYVPSEYVVKPIYDGANRKERIIYKPRFYPDQIIHWALMLQIEPIIMKGMYEYSCGSVPRRGTSYAQKVLRKWLDTDFKNTKYCLKMDISKFYPSIDNDTLKGMFSNKIKDRNCLWLINIIIDSCKGLPIGNYTSQWFSNYYLEGLDHYIKEQLKIIYYIRYVDDLVLLSANKRKLHKAKIKISNYLDTIQLTIKNNWQVFKVRNRAIDFLGFKFYRDRTILRKRNALRIKRRYKKISKKPTLNYKDASAIISYWGWIKRSNSYKFYQTYCKPVYSIGYARKVVSNYAKTNCLCRNTRV